MRSHVRSPVRSDVKSPVRSDVKSPVRSDVRSPVRSHVRSPVRFLHQARIAEREKLNKIYFKHELNWDFLHIYMYSKNIN